MTDRRVANVVLGLALLLVGGFAWSLQLRPRLEIHAQALIGLPPDLKDWHSRDIPLEETVETILHADANVQREYVRPLGDSVWLFVGYYGTNRGGRPEHTPGVCYPANGWRIERRRTVTIDPARGLRATEYVVEKNGRLDLVQFWYRSYRRTGMLGDLDLSLDHLLGQVHTGRADGALVRVSTPFRKDDEAAARGRLMAFAAALDLQLAAHWPTETPAS
ncbi:MAG TPA: EpsI family protein [Myxococcota bacterium]|nr:EpsI family protein [Myxococcota bacterium]